VDVSHSLVFIAVILGLVELVKGVFPNLPDRIRPIVCLAIGIVAAFAVAHSVWGDSQIIGDHALGSLDWVSLCVVGLVGGSAAAAAYWAGRKVVANIGDNLDGP
jgi:hypothetical protein